MAEVRICEHCGHANDISFLECEKCGSDLSLVIPVDDSDLKSSDKETPWILRTSAGETFKVTDGMIIGRMDSPCDDLLNPDDYVSRHHALLSISGNKVSIEDTSTNGTKINQQKINKGCPITLKAGDLITVGSTTFEVCHAD